MALKDNSLWHCLTICNMTKAPLRLAAGLSMDRFVKLPEGSVRNTSAARITRKQCHTRCGYSVNSRLNQSKVKMGMCLAKHKSDVAALKGETASFVQVNDLPVQSVFHDGKLWNARVLALIFNTKSPLRLINNRVTMKTCYIKNDLHKAV